MKTIILYISILITVYTPIHCQELTENGLLVTYKLDIKAYKSKNKRYTGIYKLYISDEKSVFMDEIVSKTIIYYENQDLGKINTNDRASIGIPRFNYIIEKKYTQNYTNHVEEHLKRDYIAYKEPLMKSDDWQIKQDTATYSGLMSYKATCNFGGREWTAWYAPEIPIPDGPYKFYGLPGLIVRLESNDQEYVFTLQGLVKSSEPQLIPNFKNVAKNKFLELRKFSSNPIHNMESNGVVVGGVKLNGKEMSREEYILYLNEEIMDKNFIEKE